jgi:acetyl-CoA synthetase
MSSAFGAARDLLLRHRSDYAAARREFRWPSLDRFNWALDWFDGIAERHGERPALMVLHERGTRQALTFGELRSRSNQAANFLREQGVGRGDRVLLMLPNAVALWEALLACMKLGAVIVPATTQLKPRDVQDRVDRGGVRHAIVDGLDKLEGVTGLATRMDIGASWDGVASASAEFTADAETKAGDPLLLYFTSGTTAKPKLVLHTHESYPVGHLTTMFWIGLQPGDVHWNISSPGWAKHAWSNVFAPWNAEATVLVFEYARFHAARALEVLDREKVTTLCAPPTVWRMLILEDLARHRVHLREIVAAGEPLNPEIIEQVRAAWGITIRDGYGQTETTALVGNSPGSEVKLGSMGRPLPGYDIELCDTAEQPASEGEICVSLSPRPVGLMVGYVDDPALSDHVMRAGRYHTGDVAMRDADGYITCVGRSDDVFKSSDYRISPFELESVLLEHPDVAEAAVVPSPDALRLSVPKAFVMLRPGVEPSAERAQHIMSFVRDKVPPYKRVRRLEFRDLPKTISGKIRRVELRALEVERGGERAPDEHRDSD